MIPKVAYQHVAGGAATYTAADGEIVGRAAPGNANSWLVSDTQYGDFILVFDAKTDPTLNSGVMIRGQSRPDYRKGVVFGYQAEIDPSGRAWSGGIYDELTDRIMGAIAELSGQDEAGVYNERPADA